MSDDDLRVIVLEIWNAMLGLPLEPATDPAPVDDHDYTAAVMVTVDGEPDAGGLVALRCGPELAASVAAALFELEVDEVGEDDIIDAMGELANITGGNVKSLLGARSSLTLPTVASGTHLTVTVPRSRVGNQLGFCCAGQGFTLTVYGSRTAA
ncbi:MAG: chemotaxis protein CheX [Acidimicrobiales bacterium]